MYYDELQITELIGKTLIKATHSTTGDEKIIFETDKGERYSLHHEQDCCESVGIESINDLNLLINTPILAANEHIETGGDRDACDTWTRTTYTLNTVLGMVKIVWFGSSNSYYSEGVSFKKV